MCFYIMCTYALFIFTLIHKYLCEHFFLYSSDYNAVLIFARLGSIGDLKERDRNCFNTFYEAFFILVSSAVTCLI